MNWASTATKKKGDLLVPGTSKWVANELVLINDVVHANNSNIFLELLHGLESMNVFLKNVLLGQDDKTFISSIQLPRWEEDILSPQPAHSSPVRNNEENSKPLWVNEEVVTDDGTRIINTTNEYRSNVFRPNEFMSDELKPPTYGFRSTNEYRSTNEFTEVSGRQRKSLLDLTKIRLKDRVPQSSSDLPTRSISEPIRLQIIHNQAPKIFPATPTHDLSIIPITSITDRYRQLEDTSFQAISTAIRKKNPDITKDETYDTIPVPLRDEHQRPRKSFNRTPKRSFISLPSREPITIASLRRSKPRSLEKIEKIDTEAPISVLSPVHLPRKYTQAAADSPELNSTSHKSSSLIIHPELRGNGNLDTIERSTYERTKERTEYEKTTERTAYENVATYRDSSLPVRSPVRRRSPVRTVPSSHPVTRKSPVRPIRSSSFIISPIRPAQISSLSPVRRPSKDLKSSKRSPAKSPEKQIRSPKRSPSRSPHKQEDPEFIARLSAPTTSSFAKAKTGKTDKIGSKNRFLTTTLNPTNPQLSKKPLVPKKIAKSPLKRHYEEKPMLNLGLIPSLKKKSLMTERSEAASQKAKIVLSLSHKDLNKIDRKSNFTIKDERVDRLDQNKRGAGDLHTRGTDSRRGGDFQDTDLHRSISETIPKKAGELHHSRGNGEHEQDPAKLVLRKKASRISVKTPRTERSPDISRASIFTNPLTPARVTAGNLPEIHTDDENSKKVLQDWGNTPELHRLFIKNRTVNPVTVFGAVPKLNIEEIFETQASRIRGKESPEVSPDERQRKREEKQYGIQMGYK